MKEERDERVRRDPHQHLSKIDRILIDVQRKLRDSYRPEVLENLNGFERKCIHRFFEDKPEYQTKTYRQEDRFVLRVYPIGNIKKFAEEKAREASASGSPVTLPPMGNYERFVIHDFLKDWKGIETHSYGEGAERRVEIRPVKFGRTLKRIIKKIKLF